MCLTLEQLPVEVLLYICEYLSVCDLYNLFNSCKSFQVLIANSPHFGNKLLATNQSSKTMKNRAIKELSVREKLFISYNWKAGKYKETSILRTNKKFMPWLCLSSKYILVSKGENVQCYGREYHRVYFKKEYKFHIPSDVVRFSYKPYLKNEYVVNGHRKGKICVWKIESNDYREVSLDDNFDVNAVDIGNNEIFATASESSAVKIIQFQQTRPIYAQRINDHIWSVAFSENGHQLAIGTAKYNSTPALNIFDIERCAISNSLGKDMPKGSGILDVRWYNSNILLSGGYDTNIRKWDLRTGTCVQSWEDPYNSTIYCIDTDCSHTVLSGTQSHGRVVLWDIRQKKCVQMYFMNCCKNQRNSSPVYCLAFDAYQLFVATDRNLSVLDFSKSNMPSQDYSFDFLK